MLKQRVVETNQGIQGEFDTVEYDKFARHMRDMKLTQEEQIVKSGIAGGNALEIGPGPGYLGLEWLKLAPEGRLTGLEISRNMIKIAEKNAVEYGFEGRCDYIAGNAMEMPFKDESFDAAFSNGSLHEWEDPIRIINEAYRVLKKNGHLFISDLRRDLSLPIKLSMYSTTKQNMKKGLRSSIAAAYTKNEITDIAKKTQFKNIDVYSSPFGLTVLCKKD